MTQMSKLQIRAKVLSVISEIKSLKYFNGEILAKFTDDLIQIEDKQTLLDIFIKEYIKMNESEYAFSSCLLNNIIPLDSITDKVFEYLKSKSLSDESKYKLVQLLRIIGGNCNFNELPLYFENPDEVLDLETKKLLENAVFNPEAMLDFLDFISAVSSKDRNILLDSLEQDYQGDVLANIIYPVLYSDFDDDFILKAVDILSESKSSLAVEPFNYLIKVTGNKDIKNACEKGLKKLKLAGASKEKADIYFKNILKESRPAQFFTTIPDGSGNQAILLSRFNKNKKYSLAAVVISDITGIVDCFGFFNIAQEELIKVIEKFYKSEGKYKVPPEYAKTKIQEAFNLTLALKRPFPYEFICWSILINDLDLLNSSVHDYADKNCKEQLISKNDILNLLTKEYTLRWFSTPSENKVINELTTIFYSNDNIDIDFINNQIIENKDRIFDEQTLLLWKNRVYNLIYLLRNNKKLKEADMFYTLLKNKDYFDIFVFVLIQRSIFNHFICLKENSKESSLTTNIFRKKNMNIQKYDIKKIENLISIMKRNWING